MIEISGLVRAERGAVSHIEAEIMVINYHSARRLCTVQLTIGHDSRLYRVGHSDSI